MFKWFLYSYWDYYQRFEKFVEWRLFQILQNNFDGMFLMKCNLENLSTQWTPPPFLGTKKECLHNISLHNLLFLARSVLSCTSFWQARLVVLKSRKFWVLVFRSSINYSHPFKFFLKADLLNTISLGHIYWWQWLIVVFQSHFSLFLFRRIAWWKPNN